jgi:ribonuclease P protein component
MLRRIVCHAEYQTFLHAARSFRLPHFFVPVLAEEADVFAYGITTVKKIGNAVVRNRLKRRIKAWFYQNSDILPSGIKVNLIARTGATNLNWQDLCRELSQLNTMLRQ